MGVEVAQPSSLWCPREPGTRHQSQPTTQHRPAVGRISSSLQSSVIKSTSTHPPPSGPHLSLWSPVKLCQGCHHVKGKMLHEQSLGTGGAAQTGSMFTAGFLPAVNLGTLAWGANHHTICRSHLWLLGCFLLQEALLFWTNPESHPLQHPETVPRHKFLCSGQSHIFITSLEHRETQAAPQWVSASWPPGMGAGSGLMLQFLTRTYREAKW